MAEKVAASLQAYDDMPTHTNENDRADYEEEVQANIEIFKLQVKEMERQDEGVDGRLQDTKQECLNTLQTIRPRDRAMKGYHDKACAMVGAGKKGAADALKQKYYVVDYNAINLTSNHAQMFADMSALINQNPDKPLKEINKERRNTF